MNKVRQRIAFAAAVAALAGGLSAAPAAAANQNDSWVRSCGTRYSALTTHASAKTIKDRGGSCAGDAWVRAKKKGGGWSAWQHSSTQVVINLGPHNVERAEHKGCATCEVHTTEVDE
ncbi:hypothetical protein ACWGH3_18560 [Streptomyces sp. NPDC054884]|uniref:hypothetical protein n=1 Tax=Streptomyces sp. ME08-AFT2 TaxID=3028683 RepID=UPI0029B0D161|nr:hypothetical protein [Streptomyces sp. ME08-AFT2]MDX3313181.1 hypothetical protein [Streptomyces sp. ME08-AFT2]